MTSMGPPTPPMRGQSGGFSATAYPGTSPVPLAWALFLSP